MPNNTTVRTLNTIFTDVEAIGNNLCTKSAPKNGATHVATAIIFSSAHGVQSKMPASPHKIPSPAPATISDG